MKSIYVATPFGFSQCGNKFLYETLIPMIGKNYKVINPWQLTPYEQIQKTLNMINGPQKLKCLNQMNEKIAKTNIQAMKICDGVFAVLDGSDPDSGVSSQIGFSYSVGKKILGYRGDFRRAGENDATNVNLMLKYFITNSGGKIITKLQDIQNQLNNLFN